MTTLKKLSYQIMRLLSAGPRTRDSKISEKYLYEQIRQVTNKILKIQFFEDKNLGFNDINHLMLATYDNISVLNDTVRKKNYINLPAYPIHFPGGLGIQQVKPYTGKPATDIAMIIVSPNEMDVFRGLLFEQEILKDQFIAQPDRNKIWFSERGEKTLLESGISKIEVKMCVVGPTILSDDEYWPLSADAEIDLIKEVLTLNGYTGREIHDMTNNDSPQQ